MPSWFRSLRFRLQTWHALILLLVVLGFGSVLYREIIRSRWDEIDAELLAAGRVIEGALRAVPRPILESLAQDLGQWRRPPAPPPPRRNDAGAAQGGYGPPRDRYGPPPPRSQNFLPHGAGAPLQWEPSPNGQRPSAFEEWERALELPRSLPIQLGRGDGPAYFVIWRYDGSIMRQSQVPYVDPQRPQRMRDDTEHRNLLHGNGEPLREVYLRGPEETIICVGRKVVGEVRRMRELFWQLTLAGLVILSGGLCGGWWMSRRAIVPIQRMSQTASAISATNLSQRMDLTGVDIELEQLGAVLNGMLVRLESAFDKQKRFTADASHELRTPLAIMLSTIELSLAKPRQPEEYQQQLCKCQRAAQRMHRLVEALLDLARSDEQPSTDDYREFDLQPIAQECTDALRSLAHESHVELQLQLEPTPVRGDPTELGQLITNLVTNGILYNRPGGRVTVELVRLHSSVSSKSSAEESFSHRAQLTVSDTGIGIPASHIPFIFDRFYRVDSARSQSQGGSGLGLAICQRIVTAHAGTIEVRSQPDVGSQFVVRL